MQKKLLIIWSTAELAVVKRLVLQYCDDALASKIWDEMHVMIWGPSVKILGIKQELQDAMKKLQAQGVRVTTCDECAKDYKLEEVIHPLGLESANQSQLLSEALLEDWKVVSF